MIYSQAFAAELLQYYDVSASPQIFIQRLTEHTPSSRCLRHGARYIYKAEQTAEGRALLKCQHFQLLKQLRDKRTPQGTL